MLRDMALYDTCREEWARTEARLQQEREALAARRLSTPEVMHGRITRWLAGITRPDRRAPRRRTPTHRAPLAS